MKYSSKNRTNYDPARHHRRSIRLQSHDYAAAGVYFVTICAHREFIRWAKGNPFGAHPASQGPTQVSPVRLGDVIGGFKAAVSRELRRISGLLPSSVRIWHRNYYERIVRTPEAETHIADYIRLNPWKLVQHAVCEGQAFRMIGNPALLSREKIAVLCSRNCPPEALRKAEAHARRADTRHCFIGGFHSLPERALLDALLRVGGMRGDTGVGGKGDTGVGGKGDTGVAPTVICCPAWGIDAMHIPPDWIPALETNRLLILEMRNRNGDLAAAEQRNRFVLQCAEKRWIPHVAPGGMLDHLIRATSMSPSFVRARPASPRF